MRSTMMFDELKEQGAIVADGILHNAIDQIDRALGAGYAVQHPELIAAFVRAAAHHDAAKSIARVVESAVDEVLWTIRNFGDD